VLEALVPARARAGETMGKTGKQADRNAAKKAAKSTDAADSEPLGGVAPSDLLERAKALLLGSCAARVLPELQAVLSPENGATNGHAEKPKAEEESEKPKEETATGGQDENGEDNGSGETAPKATVGDKALELFTSIVDELSLFNVLGLAEPKGAEDSKQGWLDLKELELDWGPRSKKSGATSLRIMTNLINNMPQYIHVLLAQMMLRAFFFRSWFACLPWLLFYQIVSLVVPLDGIPQLPQVPIDQCPVKFRVAGAMAIHSLVWFFFLWELVYCTYFIEKLFVPGIVLYHAYAVRPAGK